MGKVTDKVFRELSFGERQQRKSVKLPQEPSAEAFGLRLERNPTLQG